MSHYDLSSLSHDYSLLAIIIHYQPLLPPLSQYLEIALQDGAPQL